MVMLNTPIRLRDSNYQAKSRFLGYSIVMELLDGVVWVERE